MSIHFVTGNENDHFYIVTQSSEAVTLACMVPFLDSVKNKDDYQRLLGGSMTWDNFKSLPTSHVTINRKSGQVDLNSQGMHIIDVPGHEGTMFDYRGKSTFWLKEGMPGYSEVVDYSIIDLMICPDGTPKPWASRFVHTMQGKIDTSFRFRVNNGGHNAVVLFMPFKPETLDDCRIEIMSGSREPMNVEPDSRIPVSTIPQDGLYYVQWFWNVQAVQEELTVKAGETTTFDIQLHENSDNSPVERSTAIDIRARSGYVPYRRVVTDETGKAQVTVSALCMNSGDEIDLKFDAKNFTGVGSVKVKVI